MFKINRQKLSDNFIKSILQFSAGYFSSTKLDNFFDLIETEKDKFYFDSTSETNLLRIISGMYNKISFIEECINYPHYLEIIVSISATSNYLTDILVRDPEYFYWIVNPSNLNTKLSEKGFNETLNNSLKSYNSFQAKLNSLKGIKRKEILRIGIRDILEIEDLKSVTEELSIIAKGLTKNLFDLSYREVLSKYKITKTHRKYCVIALGKLGGRELNYSSDVDLMIFYDKDSKVTKNKEYFEILNEAILLFIESASGITDNGYIYRVDFRLRPDGKNSPLCNTLMSFVNYYESRGEDWERQMLIKADFICGSNDLFNKFIKFVTPFIYPRSFSTSPLEKIKRLKSEIEKKLKEEENIKLLPGGIRNIEFSVQALQLLNGGKFKELRNGNTLESIDRLRELNLLTKSEAILFREAYIFYRKIEHYLQLMNDTQTHTIPTNKHELKRLSTFLGFTNLSDFQQKVAEFRNDVQNIFNSIVGGEELQVEIKTKSSINFKNPSKAEKDLNYLREGIGLLGQKQFDKKSIELFKEIEEYFYSYLKNSENPDLVVQNFIRVIRNAKFPSIWYKEFRDKKFFNSFLNLCEFSQKGIDLFSEDKNLREYYLSRKCFLNLKKDETGRLNTKTFLFHLLNLFTLKQLTNEKISILLKEYFIIKIAEQCKNNKLLSGSNDFFIAAMGSFGSGDMTFSSDIDLIFVYSANSQVINYEKILRDFLLKLKENFSPFDVDCRLRPEGKGSQLAWEIGAYTHYINSRARIWELQAFCKLAFVAGNKKIFNKLLKSIFNKIASLDNSLIIKELVEMRKKLSPAIGAGIIENFDVKKERGGIYDIDFVVQFLMLSNPELYRKNAGKSTLQLLKNFQPASELMNSFKFLKTILLTKQNLINSDSSVLNLEPGNLKYAAKFLNFETDDDLKDRLKFFSKINKQFFDKHLPAN